MSNHDNHRRDEQKKTNHAPRYETGSGDAPSVAHARKAWKRRGARAERRTDGSSSGGYRGRKKLDRPPMEVEEPLAEVEE